MGILGCRAESGLPNMHCRAAGDSDFNKIDTIRFSIDDFNKWLYVSTGSCPKGDPSLYYGSL